MHKHANSLASRPERAELEQLDPSRMLGEWGALVESGDLSGGLLQRRPQQDEEQAAEDLQMTSPSPASLHILHRGKSERIRGEVWKVSPPLCAQPGAQHHCPMQVLDSCDVVVQVLDARDPLGTQVLGSHWLLPAWALIGCCLGGVCSAYMWSAS